MKTTSIAWDLVSVCALTTSQSRGLPDSVRKQIDIAIGALATGLEMQARRDAELDAGDKVTDSWFIRSHAEMLAREIGRMESEMLTAPDSVPDVSPGTIAAYRKAHLALTAAWSELNLDETVKQYREERLAKLAADAAVSEEPDSE